MQHSTGPSRNELSRAEHYLESFEKRVERANGVPFDLPYEAKEAMRRIKELKQAYPENEQVNTLFERARQALLASKGEGVDIPPEALAYREQTRKMTEVLGEYADREWEALLARVREQGAVLDSPFPVPSLEEQTVATLESHTIILEGFEYPKNQFNSGQGSYLFVGSQSKGFYYARLSARSFATAYEALRRYRREASMELPDSWTVIGRVVDLAMMIPEAGENPVTPPCPGWVVDVDAIYIPGQVLATAAPEGEEQGAFAGEEELLALKAQGYTVTDIPPGVEPAELVRIFATAIREKNLDLYYECLTSYWNDTGKARAMRYWEINQERYANLYVLVKPEEDSVEITTLKGESFESDEDFFLTDEDKEEVLEHAEELLEEAVVWTQRYQENGRQLTRNPVYLRRTGGREWRINGGFPL